MTPDQQAETRRIVQIWCDSSESTYPCHRALRDLAGLLEIERQPTSHRDIITPTEGTNPMRKQPIQNTPTPADDDIAEVDPESEPRTKRPKPAAPVPGVPTRHAKKPQKVLAPPPSRTLPSKLPSKRAASKEPVKPAAPKPAPKASAKSGTMAAIRKPRKEATTRPRA